MNSFVEYIDYQFFTQEYFYKEKSRSLKRTYVVIKDADVDKFVGNHNLPTNYDLVVASTDQLFIKDCVEYAVRFHLSNVERYSYSVNISQ